jgi:hypothetical protein
MMHAQSGTMGKRAVGGRLLLTVPTPIEDTDAVRCVAGAAARAIPMGEDRRGVG